MNKHLLLILLGFGSFCAFDSFSENSDKFPLIQETTTCKVTDMEVIIMEDGETKKQKFFAYEPQIGDEFTLKFEFSDDLSMSRTPYYALDIRISMPEWDAELRQTDFKNNLEGL